MNQKALRVGDFGGTDFAYFAVTGVRTALGTPLKRHGKAEDMAGVAIYLTSPAASFGTDVVIPVDGGITVAKPTR